MRSILRLLLIVSLAAPVAAIGVARDPDPVAEQYTHSSWTSKDGVPGMVQALAQTSDGYLWVGTYEGLFRFDGVSFDHVAPAVGHPPGSIPVSALLVSRNGDLWVGYAGGAGVEVMRSGQLRLTGMPHPPGEITGLAEDRAGGIWAVGGRGRKALKRYADGHWQAIDARWGIPDDESISMVLPTRDGSVWAATNHQLMVLKPGARHFDATGLKLSNGAGLAQDRDGNIWLSDAAGTRIVTGYEQKNVALRSAGLPRTETSNRKTLLFDLRGNLWGSTHTDGIFRIPRPDGSTLAHRPIIYRTQEGLTSNEAVAIYEDREGSIWVATELGLDQFRRANIEGVPLALKDLDAQFIVSSDDRGDVYVASGSRLFRAVPDEEMTLIHDGGIDIEALCRGRGGLWVVQRNQVLRVEDGKIARSLAAPNSLPITGCGENQDGHLWLANQVGDIYTRSGERWDHATPFGKRTPPDITISWHGRTVGTIGRKSVAIHDGARTLTLPADKLGVSGLTVLYGNAKGLLIGGGTGLARWDGQHVQRLTIAEHPWLRGMRGIVQTSSGDTWMVNNNGVVKVVTADLDRAFDHPREPIAHDRFDEQDGFNSRTQNSQSLQMVLGGDDRIWILTRQGVLRVDPSHLQRNPVPPPIAIRAVTADGRRIENPSRLDLPAGTKNLSIEYTALSLAIPSRVSFRYRLKGFDTEWVDPGQRRQAFYTNLPPGDYTFSVIAANNDGVWNRQGPSLEIKIPPTFVQSRLFLILCLVVATALLWLLYRFRLHTIATRMRVRLSERLAERERIAREIHDTLLQSIQALILKFQLAADEIPEEQAARRSLEQALDLADQVLAEGRNRVRDLRLTESGDNLEAMIGDIVQRLVFPESTHVQVATIGETRHLNLIACDEVARIANEAIFNIWRHANASRVDIRIVFGAAKLAVSFKDNGVGIPRTILDEGQREGHYGLPGMRERASRLEGEIILTSTEGAGTELMLHVPASVAYAKRKPVRSLLQSDEQVG